MGLDPRGAPALLDKTSNLSKQPILVIQMNDSPKNGLSLPVKLLLIALVASAFIYGIVLLLGGEGASSPRPYEGFN